jgi:biopolymer transport protein ExbD
MAELNTSGKIAPKVDLTAMVDLAFLLITFFMLTTSLSKPVAMDIAKPDRSEPSVRMDVPASRTMTILLGKNNKVVWYMGETKSSKPKIESFTQLRQSLLLNDRSVNEANGNDPKKSLFVIVKPTSGSTYKDFVDVMDELHLSKISSAPAIDDENITDEEKDFMSRNQIL